MPLAFPSHQGLIAPLWRRWPERFNILPCCIGAAVPDMVDGAIGIYRGHLGQGYGHSLFGLFALCMPVGVALNAVFQRWRRDQPSLVMDAWSVWVGALSHIFFDFISHTRFLLLYPWYEDPNFFPAWWYARWFDIPLPFYREPFGFGLPLVIWFLLSALGAWLFFRRQPGR